MESDPPSPRVLDTMIGARAGSDAERLRGAVPGLVYIDVPANVVDKYMTVVALKLDKPVKLYRGRGGFD